MISTELNSRRVAAPDERATLFPTGGACSSLATAVRLQRLDGLLDGSTATPVSGLFTTGTPAVVGALPPFDERSERHECQGPSALHRPNANLVIGWQTSIGRDLARH